MSDKKASDFVLSWSFVQKIVAGRGVWLKKRCGMPFPHQIHRKNWFAGKNFHTGFVYKTTLPILL